MTIDPAMQRITHANPEPVIPERVVYACSGIREGEFLSVADSHEGRITLRIGMPGDGVAVLISREKAARIARAIYAVVVE